MDTNRSTVKVLLEAGYGPAALGFSLSFNSTPERARIIMPQYAFGKVAGENKFLRVMWIWLDVDFPRMIWQEADQYKVGATTLSESTVHTLKKRHLTQDDFVVNIDDVMIDNINQKIDMFNRKEIDMVTLKSHLPEGFLQRRIWNMNYATLQNIVNTRRKHRVALWDMFIDDVLSQIEHPEFIVQPKKEEKDVQ